MLVRIVGLGPGDPDLLTLGSLDALRATGRAVALLAPPELTKYLGANGVEILRHVVADPALLVRGSVEACAAFVAHAAQSSGDIALGVLGNPLSDFPGLPPVLRGLEVAGIATQIV
ncbi:MAG TPA: SAM-dependent methyltransferase, partial [Candidatus Baltobacteraceae bacterium]